MSDEEYPWYQLKYSIAEFMIPKLEDYKNNYQKTGMSIPSLIEKDESRDFSDEKITRLRKDWLSKLEVMIVSFKMVLNYNAGDNPDIPYDEDLIQEGLELFAKYYQDLWD